MSIKNHKKAMKIKNHKNKKLLLFIIIFIGGYFFFFTSNLWYPDDSNNVKATAIFRQKTGILGILHYYHGIIPNLNK